jgi:putative DNA primase/helicase
MSAVYVLVERARDIQVEDELARRGVTLSGCGFNRAGPCPRCGGVDRFGINLKKQLWNCRGCKRGGDVIDLVRLLDGCDFVAAVKTLTGEQWAPWARTASGQARLESTGAYEREQQRKAAWLWSKGQLPAGTIVESYFASRGINGPLPPTLRYLPPSRPEHHPAMMAAFAMADEPELGILAAPRHVGAVHLTLLTADGRGKADVPKPKIVIGRPLGRPISLAPINDLLALCITEGIEDGLALHRALGVGAWAAGSAPLMPKLAEYVPDWIETIIIELHPDDGRRHAECLAENMIRRGVEVVLREAST